MGKTVKKFMEGNDAMVAGAIAAGARFYAGYPISPSSEVAKGAAKELPVTAVSISKWKMKSAPWLPCAGLPLLGRKPLRQPAVLASP